jgi:hypothetical protein
MLAGTDASMEGTMTELVFALEFKGTAEPVPGSSNRLRARTTAPDQTLQTMMKPDGVQGAVQRMGGDAATFESEVEMLADGAFLESGSIAYGSAGTVRFKTIGRGVLGASPMTGVQRGAVVWEVTGGDGGLRGASGIITSNFTVGSQGEVTDNQFARIYLP